MSRPAVATLPSTPAAGERSASGRAALGPPLIELREVTKTYRRGDVPVAALRGVNLAIWRGEMVAIMGASGSGKSTLMNLIGCLDRPSGGSYRFAGREVSRLGPDDLARLRRDTFGFVFQQYNLLPGATATENVELPAVYAGLPHAARVHRARQILSTLGLADRLEHRPSHLSGGQQQRVSIARALMNGGEVILADEPTGALDTSSGREMLRLLEDLNARGHTVILITHDADVAAAARRTIQIRDGAVVADTGPAPPAVATSPPAPVAAVRGALGTLPDVAEAVKMAFRSLRANMLRTLLTLLGIIIGVGSVVTMIAIGDGAKQDVIERIQAMGSNLLLVRPGAPNVRGSASGLVATLLPADADAIARLANVESVVPEFPTQVTVRFGSTDYVSSANSTVAAYPLVHDWPMAEGVFFSDADVRSYAPVVVLGRTVANTLFPNGTEALGNYVLLNNIPFQVIGIMASKGATPWGSDMDDVMFVPLSTGRLRLFGQRYVKSISIQVQDVGTIQQTQEAIRRLLLARHGTEDFRIRNMASLLDTVSATQGTLTVLLGSIAAISLLVGGIGVMNIMLVSVTERTREIGIRMAAGARRSNILLQFNTEALAVCTVGGVIGVLGGLATAWVFAQAGRPIVFSAGPVALAFGCAFVTGVLFGYLPARKAANLDPVVALGTE